MPSILLSITKYLWHDLWRDTLFTNKQIFQIYSNYAIWKNYQFQVEKTISFFKSNLKTVEVYNINASLLSWNGKTQKRVSFIRATWNGRFGHLEALGSRWLWMPLFRRLGNLKSLLQHIFNKNASLCFPDTGYTLFLATAWFATLP